MTTIIDKAPLSRTNVIQWKDEWYEDGSGHTGWTVFTSSFDFPKEWNHAGWEISSSCNMGYRTDVWKTTNRNAVIDDLDVFSITQEAHERLACK